MLNNVKQKYIRKKKNVMMVFKIGNGGTDLSKTKSGRKFTVLQSDAKNTGMALNALRSYPYLAFFKLKSSKVFLLEKRSLRNL